MTYGSGSSAELKLVGEQSGGDWAAVESRLRAGDEPALHTHTRADETVYVLEGAITTSGISGSMSKRDRTRRCRRKCPTTWPCAASRRDS